MLTLIKSAAATATLAFGTLVSLAATPAQAATVPECTSYVTITQGNYSAQKPAYNGSTTCWLGRGSQGLGVKALQRNLRFCYRQNIMVDGSFGPATEQALKNAQASHGLVPDGHYGPLTRARLILFYQTADGSSGGC